MSVNYSSQGPEVNKNKSLYHVIVGDWEHKLRTNLNITQTLAEIKIFNHLEQQRTQIFTISLPRDFPTNYLCCSLHNVK